MSFSSDFLRPAQTMGAKAGPLAIAVKDLLTLTRDGGLYKAVCSDYAKVAAADGTVLFQPTVSNFSATGFARHHMQIDPTDGGIFIIQGYITTADGMRAHKYSSDGTLIKTLILDSTSTATSVSPCLERLSDGNYVAVWGVTGNNIKFAIFDPYLNIVVAATAVDTLDATSKSFHAIALSGGGFAVGYSKTNPWVAIYSNAGAVVTAAAALTNAAAFGVAVYMQLAQLSNGNIAYAIGSSTAAKILGHAVTTAAGVNVVQVTLLGTGTAVTLNDVEICAMTGYYAVSSNSSGRQEIYILSNAGAVQGAAASAAIATTQLSKIITDGARFWFFYPSAAGTSFNVVGCPTTGTNYVTTNITASGTGDDSATGDAFFDGKYLVFRGNDRVYVMTPLASGAIYLTRTVAVLAPIAGSIGCCARNGGDFVVLTAGNGNSNSLNASKYLNACIFGVALNAVAAGNEGTSVRALIGGPSAYPCNAVVGSVGVAFDHTTAAVVGNKGTIYTNGVQLRGAGAGA
jgi:hypothetical protein